MTHRRGNGLLAETYVPLILLSPVLADVMLDAWRRAGIAAYALPSASGELAAAPAQEHAGEQLYVDSSARAAAEEILRSELPELEEHSIEARGGDSGDKADAGPPLETAPAGIAAEEPEDAESGGGRQSEDAVWADLVARFYEEGSSSADAAEWPDAENISADDRADHDEDPLSGDDDALSTQPAEPAGRSASRGRDEEHFIPPTPPPLPRGDLTSRLAWSGLFGGPALLFLSVLTGINVPDWLMFGAVAVFIAGFIVLVVRMGDRPPRDDGPDDGAVI